MEVNASLRWRSGSLIKETIWLSIIPITKDAEEVGPTAKCLELPKTEYSNGGTKLESEAILILSFNINVKTFSFKTIRKQKVNFYIHVH